LITHPELLNEELSPSYTPKFELEDVHLLQLQQVAPGQIGVTFLPWILGDFKAKITIEGAHVMTSYVPTKNLEDMFVQATSNIALAKSLPQAGPNTRIQL
jgi:hypothetical protein